MSYLANFSPRRAGARYRTWVVTDIKVPRYIHLIDTIMDVNRCKFHSDQSFGVATSIQTCSEVRSVDVTCRPDLK